MHAALTWRYRRLVNGFAPLGRPLRWLGDFAELCRDRRRLWSAIATWGVRRLWRRSFIARDAGGFRYRLYPEEPIETLFANGYLGHPELGEQAFCRNTVTRGMTVFDVGANIGQYTLLFSRAVGGPGTVVAFEACSTTVRRLVDHLSMNGASHNVTVEHRAAHHHDDSTIELHVFPPEYSVWNTQGTPVMRSRGKGDRIVEPVSAEQVPTIRLDTYCDTHAIARIDYLKVDVEGAELEVLQGAEGLLRTGRIGYVQFEISRDMSAGMGRDGSEVFGFLTDCGYVCRPIRSDGTLGAPTRHSASYFCNFIAEREDMTDGDS